MFKTIASVLTTLSLLGLASAQSDCNGTQYLEVTLWDSFGDGWDSAYWMMHDPAGVLSQDQSTCDEIEKVFQVQPCDHDPVSGYYYMIANTVDEVLPEGWWEVYWKVEVFWVNGTTTGESYEGVYNTTMVWEYDQMADRWSLTHYDGIPDFECDGCSGGECKPKPKPKGKGKNDKKGKDDKKGKGPLKGDGKGGKGKGGKGDSDSEESSNSTGSAPARFLHASSNSSFSERSMSGSSTNGTSDDYGPRAVNLEVTMYDQADSEGNCNGWNDINRIGAHWYIADSSLTKVFDDGSLCSGCAGSCNICLGDGSYVFRVTGPTFNETQEEIWWDKVGGEPDAETVDGQAEDHSVLDSYRAPYTAWEFCHAKGFFNDQLNFHVKKGKCIPDDLRWADEICDGQENSTVTLNGVIALAGINSEILHSADITVLGHIIAATVEGWTADMVAITGSSIDARALTTGERALNVYNHDIAFAVTFNAEKFGIDGATYGAVENLVSDISATIEASLTSGVFVSALSGSVLMGSVTGGELVSLEISTIAFSHSHLVYVYTSEDEKAIVSSSSSSSGMSSSVVTVAGVVVVLAFVAFVGIASHNFNGYNKVNSNSDSDVRAVVAINAEVELEEVRHPFANSDGVAKKMKFPTRRV
jgi:hypothetical protein